MGLWPTRTRVIECLPQRTVGKAAPGPLSANDREGSMAPAKAARAAPVNSRRSIVFIGLSLHYHLQSHQLCQVFYVRHVVAVEDHAV